MKTAGLDIGTTGCKITVFDESGANLGKEYTDYPVKRKLGLSEIDPFALCEGVFSVIKKAAARFPDIAGIGITSFGESFIAADESGNPVFPIMLYTDPRGKEQCEKLTGIVGKERLNYITGLNPHEMYSLPKIMWLKDNEPLEFKKVRYIFLICDYIGYLLTGNRIIDYSLATRTMAFDINTLMFSHEILDAAGISPDMFSHPSETGTDAGTVTAEISSELGLGKDCRIVIISHDQVAACVGSGALKPGMAVDGAGTVECITPVFAGIPEPGLFQKNNYNVVPYFDSYVAYAFSYTGGALLGWCVDTLCKKEKELAAEEKISVHQYIQKNPYDITGMLVLPHFAGAATPYMDTGSKGVITGLLTSTSIADIYYACMEGVAYEMRLNMERIGMSGIKFERLIATGGGAKSRVWMQIKADVLGLPIDILESEEAGTVGSAILTGVACGLFTDINEGIRKMVKITDTVYPDLNKKKKYDEVYSRYVKLYDSVRNLL